jgi:orotate phosphoribosyltransferase
MTSHTAPEDRALAREFVAFAVEAGVLRFGEFRTKAGRLSPYFFNAGLFDDGAKLGRLASFYAGALLASGLPFDMLFGPAYKGIALASAIAVELARRGRNVPFAYNRKEAKDHGEGGVVIVDDVISAGTSVRESLALIGSAGAVACGVAIALDRQEKAAEGGRDSDRSAVQHVREELDLAVITVATLDDLLDYLRGADSPALRAHADGVQAYRARYGV